jgi:hypothetical protein
MLMDGLQVHQALNPVEVFKAQNDVFFISGSLI